MTRLGKILGGKIRQHCPYCGNQWTVYYRKECGDPSVRFYPGECYRGEGAVVGKSTELKNVILFNKVQVPHYNYVGDSVLGYKAHMGAGSITSNVKSDKNW